MEILSPAGSSESLIPAVRMGADAVYLGISKFSARASAENFNIDKLQGSIEYCHERNVKVYIAMNTLMTDDELPDALRLAEKAYKAGADAFIIQDLGFGALLKKACPSIRLHGSTQMSVHTPMGAKLLYEMGYSRVVLSRELSRNEIKDIAESCPIETEVFVHGALCMCVSGQCYMSAFLGSRSGNRGRCAQPCRLPFSVKGGTGYDLSLKDLSLTDYIRELDSIGVTSAKIEGRMKRPEYAAAAVSACRQALDEGKVNDSLKKELKSVFSRSGFTSGYYTGNLGKNMFGTRVKEDVTSADSATLKNIRARYLKEPQKIPVTFDFTADLNKNAVLTVSDEINKITVSGDICQKAVNTPLTEDKCISLLSKTGGTPYYPKKINVKLDGESVLTASSINALRRDALEKLKIERTKVKTSDFIIPDLEKSASASEKSKLLKYYVLRDIRNIDKYKEHLVFVPYYTQTEKVKCLLDDGYKIGIELPRGMFGIEDMLKKKLENFKAIGVNHILTGNLGGVSLGRALSMSVHGDFGLNIFNSYSLLVLKELGAEDAVISMELTFKQISKIVHHIPVGVFSNGYAPLMLTRNCPNKNSGLNCGSCKQNGYITDRLGKNFPVRCYGTATEILNCVPTVSAPEDIKKCGADFEIIRKNVDNYVDKVDNYEIFADSSYNATGFTRGLYYRGVK